MDKDINPGDLLWGKVESHPWWPGVVCEEPSVNEYVKTNHRGTFYNLQFLSNPPSRGWVKDKNLKEFKGIDVTDCKKGGIFYCSKKSFQEALEEAAKAQEMSAKERLALVQNGDQESEQWTDEENTTYIIGKTKIPLTWKTPYVLISTNVPEDLTVKGFVTVSNDKIKKPGVDKGKSLAKKRTSKGKHKDKEEDAEEEEREMSDIPEEEFEDSDEFVADLADDDEEDIDFSEDDWEDEWAPSKKKKKMEFTSIKTKRKFQTKKISETKSSSSSKNKAKPSVSLTNYTPPKLVEDQQTTTNTSTASSESSNSSQSTSATKSTPTPTPTSGPSKPIIITNLTATGEEPSIGDFLLEKAECKDGNVPFLWRYKKGGLIQKYEKITENDKTFYQNILSFSDWWSCYANRYQKVETRVIFRYKNVEKVELLGTSGIPETSSSNKETSNSQEKDKDSTQQQSSSEKTSEKDSSSNEKTSESTEGTSKEKTQEQEVSSTTPDFSEFQIGRFVLDKKDAKNVDGFPIWKIESGILLRKFEAVVKNGNLYHQPTKTYRGYKDKEIGKFYNSLKVKKVYQNGQDYMEVLEESRPKVVIDSDMEKEFDQHPLLHHFYVYLQAYLSQALEDGFLAEIQESQDETFVFPMSEINKIVNQKVVNLERKVRFTHKIRKALQKCPYLRDVYKPDKTRTCEAVLDTTDVVEHNVFLYGPEYDEDTMVKSDNSPPCQEFKVGPTALENINKYHKLCHFKFNLFEMCLAKIKLIRERNKKADVTEVMDACLGNKAWVLQNFSEFMDL